MPPYPIFGTRDYGKLEVILHHPQEALGLIHDRMGGRYPYDLQDIHRKYGEHFWCPNLAR